MRDKVSIEINEVLDTIAAAETYGYYDDVLMGFFADLLGKELSDKEIDNYISTLSEEYGEEDRDNCKTTLLEFRTKYIE